MATTPTFREEQKLWNKGYNYVAGTDEVGRGCFAGPVVTAAVILPPDFSSPIQVNDSKLLKPRVRTKLAKLIKEKAVAFSVAEISVGVINKIGIGKATQQGFRSAIKQLSKRPDFILIDAFYIKHLSRKNQKPLVGGDGISISIAAASILAKVHRDKIMKKLHLKYKEYGFAKNKGYGTKMHQEAIKKYGLSRLHRKSFDLNKFLNISHMQAQSAAA